MAPEETSVSRSRTCCGTTRAALEQRARALDVAGAGSDDVTYQRWLLVKGAAQASIGDTEDGARILREVKGWAEEHDEQHAAGAQPPAAVRAVPPDRRPGADARARGDGGRPARPRTPTDSVRADHLIGLADALGASGSYDDSIRRYQEAAQLADACGDRYLQLAVLNNLAYTQYEAGLRRRGGRHRRADADRLAAEGLPLRTHDGDTIARAYSMVGRFEEAAAVLEPLIAESDTGEDCDGLVLALLTLTDVRRRLGRLRRGAGLARPGLPGWPSTTPSPAGPSRRSSEQAELYAARGDYQRGVRDVPRLPPGRRGDAGDGARRPRPHPERDLRGDRGAAQQRLLPRAVGPRPADRAAQPAPPRQPARRAAGRGGRRTARS